MGLSRSDLLAGEFTCAGCGAGCGAVSFRVCAESVRNRRFGIADEVCSTVSRALHPVTCRPSRKEAHPLAAGGGSFGSVGFAASVWLRGGGHSPPPCQSPVASQIS